MKNPLFWSFSAYVSYSLSVNVIHTGLQTLFKPAFWGSASMNEGVITCSSGLLLAVSLFLEPYLTPNFWYTCISESLLQGRADPPSPLASAWTLMHLTASYISKDHFPSPSASWKCVKASSPVTTLTPFPYYHFNESFGKKGNESMLPVRVTLHIFPD